MGPLLPRLGSPGVTEQMAADAGLEFFGRGTAQVINELPTATRLHHRKVCRTG